MCNREVERRCNREIPGRSRVRVGDEVAVTRQKAARSFVIFFRGLSRYSFAVSPVRQKN